MKRSPLLRAPGKHRRPPARAHRARWYASAFATPLVLALAGSAQALPAHTAAAPAVQQSPLAEAWWQAQFRAAQPWARTVTVGAGQSLSGIAMAACGTAADWTGLYAANRAVIGTNPSMIQAGQHLTVSCADPSWPLRLLPSAAPPMTATASTTAAVTPAGGSAVNVSFQSVYSYTGLENLWMNAGGPAWEAPTMATIAECESGGRADAYNSEFGASGVWQILGAPSNWTGSTDWFNPFVNAQAAVAKWEQAGDSTSPWVCQ